MESGRPVTVTRAKVSRLLRSQAEVGHVQELELEPIRVVEEHRVITRQVAVVLRLTLDRPASSAHPLRALIHGGPRRDLDGEMVQAYRIPVDRPGLALRLAQADRRSASAQVPDGLAALALDLA